MRTNPLGITPRLRAALERASREQLKYEIPVDLNQCSEEEKEFWLIKRANIRNGGRVRENPLWRETQVDPEDCKDDQGRWLRFIRARLTPEEQTCLDQLNALCDNHIVTSDLSENHRIRFLISFRCNV